jgi:hypothetical protein
MLEPNLKEYCNSFTRLIGLSDDFTDNLHNVYIEGCICESAKKELLLLSKWFVASNEKIVTITFDTEEIDLASINAEFGNSPARFDLTLEKAKLLKICGYDSSKTKFYEYLFLSSDFLTEPTIDFLGTDNPFKSGLLNRKGKIRIQVYDLEQSVGSENLSIIPIDEPYEIDYLDDNFRAPKEEKIKNSIRILSSEETRISPESYRLSWGGHKAPIFNRIKISYLQTLLSCVCSAFYSESKVVVEGLKKIDVSLSKIEFDNSIDEKINIAEQVVSWIFLEDDYETKKTLYSDRLTLDLIEGQNILLIKTSLLINALSQAKSKYKYVIAERNDDYRKELKDLYSDVKVFTDSLGSACESLSKGLITDLLSIGFIFSLTMFARIALNKNELLFSPQISLLFNLIAAYLITAFLFRFWNARKSLTFAEIQFDEWSKRLHNHISSSEIKLIKRKMTLNPTSHFESVSAVVGGLHLLLAFGITQFKVFL